MRIWSHLLATALKRINRYWYIHSCPMAHYRIASMVSCFIKLYLLFTCYTLIYNPLFFLVGEASKRKVLDWPTRLSVCIGAARGKKHLCCVNTHSACFSLAYRGIKLNILFCAIPGMSCCFVLTFGL